MTAPISATPDQARSWLQAPGFSLGSNQFTYSIPGASATWAGYAAGSEPFSTSYAAPNAALAAGFRAVIAVWDDIIAPDFTEVLESGSTVGELRVAFTDVGSSFGYAYSGTPQTPGRKPGDVWISPSQASSSYAPGDYSYMALLHEVGHTLGLKHSFEAPAAPTQYDNYRYTIMSYTAIETAVTFTPAGNGGLNASSQSVVASTPMVLDILAAQAIYGAETSTRAGDTIYTFQTMANTVQTIWDGGGTDRIDAANFNTPVNIDLRPGAYSSLGVMTAADQIAYWSALYPNSASFIRQVINGTANLFTYTENVAIAFGVTIENATGGTANDTLIGNDVANVLSGGPGTDTMTGLGGNDTYLVDRLGDQVIEAAGGGNDTVFALGSYFLPAGSEVETLSTASNSASTTSVLVGNEYAQAIIGDFGNNLLGDGGLTSGPGDVLLGLKGDDTYQVDSVRTFVIENAGEGADVVIVSALGSNFVLNANTSVETLRAAAGTAAINITGNPDSQRIEGNDGNNILSTGSGAADTLVGGLGDDTYRVFGGLDTIVEASGQGLDRVFVSGNSFALNAGASVEYVSVSVQADTGNFYLVGNEVSQVIVGNYGDNTLDGNSQNSGNPDTMIGLLGNDIYRVNLQADVIQEAAGQGTDTALASVSYQLRNGVSVETLSAVNQSASDAGSQYVLRGNEVSQVLIGNDAANTLDGRGGNDILIGRGGADVFAFTTAPGSGNVDTIQDFVSGTDKIGLASDIFASVTAGGIIGGEFIVGTGAADGDDRLIYNQAAGQLFYDADANGAGAQILIAQLTAGAALAVTDFVVVAPVADLPG